MKTQTALGESLAVAFSDRGSIPLTSTTMGLKTTTVFRLFCLFSEIAGGALDEFTPDGQPDADFYV